MAVVRLCLLTIALATGWAVAAARAQCGDRALTSDLIQAEALTADSITFRWRKTTGRSSCTPGVSTHLHTTESAPMTPAPAQGGGADPGELFAYYNGYKVNANNAPFANESWRAKGSKWTDVRHLALGDVTGDGYADVVGVAGNGELFAYYNGYKVNAGNAPFANESWRAKGSTWTDVRHLALGDVTGDGYADVVGVAGNGELFAYYNGYKVNAGNAPFANESWRAKGSKWTDVRHLAIGDVTGDRYADVAGASG